MNNTYLEPSCRRFLKILFPDTIPKTVQNNRVLMVYDRMDMPVGCFFSLEECADFFNIKVAILKNAMYKKTYIYGLYKPQWVRTGGKNGWHYNNGEII